MPSCKLITYDLNNATSERSQQITDFIKNNFDCLKPLNTSGVSSTWIVSTLASREQIKTILKSTFEKGDKFVVVELAAKSDDLLKGKPIKIGL
ncbi:MAG: hypothetical protein FD167_5628 [bacterium]|nr:MAG: hypothetical protein FD167_5628 [bacterium]